MSTPTPTPPSAAPLTAEEIAARAKREMTAIARTIATTSMTDPMALRDLNERFERASAEYRGATRAHIAGENAAPLTAEEIAEIAERAAKATPAPWKREAEYFVAEVPQGRPGGEVIGSAHPSSSYLSGYPRTQQVANAKFIIHARTDVPALIASHARLIAMLRVAREELARWETRQDYQGDSGNTIAVIDAMIGKL